MKMLPVIPVKHSLTRVTRNHWRLFRDRSLFPYWEGGKLVKERHPECAKLLDEAWGFGEFYTRLKQLSEGKLGNKPERGQKAFYARFRKFCAEPISDKAYLLHLMRNSPDDCLTIALSAVLGLATGQDDKVLDPLDGDEGMSGADFVDHVSCAFGPNLNDLIERLRERKRSNHSK